VLLRTLHTDGVSVYLFCTCTTGF